MSSPEELWTDLSRSHPAAAQLAIPCSLPVRISPAFVRLARQRLIAESTTGNEADLWLSGLVEAKSSGGFSFRRPVREYLRSRLTADPQLLERVWHEVHQPLSPWLTPKGCLEEEQTWRLMRDPGDPKIDQNWRSVWQEIRTGDNAKGVARWAIRAIADMPPQALKSEWASKVWIASHLLTGDIGALGSEPQDFIDSGEFDFATRQLPRTTINVGLIEDGLIFSPSQKIRNGHEIVLPMTTPLWVQIEDQFEPIKHVVSPSGSQPVRVETNVKQPVLRLIDGSSYAISRSATAQTFKGRRPAARTNITYARETYGSEEDVTLPFVTAVMADFSGNAIEEPVDLAGRRFLQVDIDNFNEILARIRPRVSYAVDDVVSGEGKLSVELEFTHIDDFRPELVTDNLPFLRTWSDSGENYNRQVSAVLHHPDFQSLESTWRGLHSLVARSETDDLLKIRILDVSKRELARMFRRYAGSAWDQSPLFRLCYEQEYGQLGGEPYGCIVGDYYFDHSPGDTQLLAGMAQLCAALHAPFLAGASPGILGMESWNELSNPRDLAKILMTPEYAAWQSLRESEDSRYIALAMPRFLSRSPYENKHIQDETPLFTELVSPGEEKDFTWSNSAYLMAANIHRAFSQFQWVARIRGPESGGAIEDLPAYTFPADDGSVDNKCPTEIAITDRREVELSRQGLLPLIHRKNSDVAAFISAQSLQKPVEYDDRDASANSLFAARLPYIFSACRFMHYVKCIVRDKIGSFLDREALQSYLNEWIHNYVDPNPDVSSETGKAQRPLAAGSIEVEEVEGSPGYYTAKMYVRPQFQLEGLTVSLRLVTKLPSGDAALGEFESF